jgi:uncharacterized protein DUF6316
MVVRAGESNKTWFRGERFLCIGGLWYFITREFTQEGPFDNRSEAELELILYIRHNNGSFFIQSQAG